LYPEFREADFGIQSGWTMPRPCAMGIQWNGSVVLTLIIQTILVILENRKVPFHWIAHKVGPVRVFFQSEDR
jgi:hypothetical protein